MSRKRKIAATLVGIGVFDFLILQVIPVGSFRDVLRRKANPSVIATIEWNSPDTQNLVKRACFDCHSNETIYPWYAQVAPVSWLVTRDVNKGRAAMNFSEDAATEYNLDDLEWHLSNDMPPNIYLIMHPEVYLTDEQKILLLSGFQKTFTTASQESMDMDG